jgi:hypothetical protein
MIVDDVAPKKRNGWQAKHAERHASILSRMRGHGRFKVLQRHAADPMFLPGTRTLAPDFAEAVERFMNEREARR